MTLKLILKLGFGPGGWDLGIEAEIWATGFELSLEIGILTSRPGFEL